ncbi:hypothetical protein Poli38472_001346 [Pythium oligandrum]|uniref:2,4-dienoyl-CoA reductase [(3E)-enoyl-CoA-producing] n=1 Tax=Pythium oligandrum TaxID=41045 RepID=A0A8K1CTA3_PYTOL|nr:hypothetical protein Poli38472_001346 [Pythium oligandrum]|eukprot:TMW69190.1 hypothetical protein Poli38472_001346 [Pythium oligandrum]
MDSASIARVFRPDALQGRVALVTGGGSGIGQEIALKFAQYGAKVAIMGRREAVLEITVQLIHSKTKRTDNAIYVKGDVRSEEDAIAAVQKTVEAFGKLDVLVNGAAGNFLTLPENLSTRGFRTVMEIDAVGTFNMSRHAFSALKESGDARIINLTATLHMPATWFQVHASAAKAAVDSITRTLALEWGAFGIRVMSVAPGPIADTAGLSKLAGNDNLSEVNDTLKDIIPLGRPGTRCDIASAVMFLVSAAGSFVSGDTLIVDGASYLYKPPVMSREVVGSWSKQMEKKSRAPKSKL